MISAMVSTRSISLRWPLLGLALLALALEPGCARLRSFHKDDPSAFGTDTAWSDRGPDETSPVGDLYADLATKSRPRPGPEIIARKLPSLDLKPVIDESRPLGESQAPAIILQAPIALPTITESTTRIVAPIEIRVPPVGQIGLGTVLAETRKALDALATYQVKMTHQERVNNILNPVEDVRLSIRRAPKAVRLEWPEGQNKGREVIYAADANSGLMHVKMAPTLVPLPRISMAPDSPLATHNSRHPITEAGFDTIVASMEQVYVKSRGHDMSLGVLSYEGLVVPAGKAKPFHKIVRVTPTQETWTVFIDPTTHLPASVQEVAPNGDLLERYTFGDPILNAPELANPDAFDPDGRWGPQKGLFQRLARSPEADKSTATH